MADEAFASEHPPTVDAIDALGAATLKQIAPSR